MRKRKTKNKRIDAKQPAMAAATSETKEKASVNIRKGSNNILRTPRHNKQVEGSKVADTKRGQVVRSKKLCHQTFIQDEKKKKLSQIRHAVSSIMHDCASNSFKKLRSGNIN